MDPRTFLPFSRRTHKTHTGRYWSQAIVLLRVRPIKHHTHTHPTNQMPCILTHGLANTVAERPTRRIELVVVPSTSPANARTRNAHKVTRFCKDRLSLYRPAQPCGRAHQHHHHRQEKMWHRDCYCLDRVPKSYTCCVCGTTGVHWSADCSDKPGGYSEWRRRRQQIPARKDPDVDGTRWYVWWQHSVQISSRLEFTWVTVHIRT